MSMLLTGARLHVTGPDGDPLAGGWVYTYAAGTTTPKVTYNDSALTSPKTNPFQLDAYGESTVWMDGAYKVNIEDANHIQIPGYPVDNVTSEGSSSDLTFIQAGTGAVQRSAQDKMRERVTILDFMTTAQILDYSLGNATLDILVPIQNAVNYVGGVQKGGKLVFPAGAGMVSGAVLIPYDCVTLEGAGRGASGTGLGVSENAQTLIITTSATANVFHFQCDNGGTVKDMTIRSNVGRSAGYAIVFDGASGGTFNSYGSVDNVTIQNTYNGIKAASTALLTINKTVFLDHTAYGLTVANPNSPDTGDSYAEGCTFISSNPLAIHVQQSSAGGLKFVNCKFLACKTTYLLDIANGVNTSDLFFVGCSIENYTEYGLAFTRSSGNGTFFNVVVSGTQFLSDGTAVAAITSSGTTSNWLQDATFTGGSMNIQNGFGLALDRITNAKIDMVMKGNGANTAISLGANCDEISVRGNIKAFLLNVDNLATSSKINVRSDVSDKYPQVIPSATPMAIPADGEYFIVSGTQNFAGITASAKQYGKRITLQFQGALMVVHGSGILLAGAVNFNATANDTLTLVWDGTNFVEQARTVI